MKYNHNYFKTIWSLIVAVVFFYRVYRYLKDSGLWDEIMVRYKEMEPKLEQIKKEVVAYVEKQKSTNTNTATRRRDSERDSSPVMSVKPNRKQPVKSAVAKSKSNNSKTVSLTKSSVKAIKLPPRSRLVYEHIKQKNITTMSDLSRKFKTVTPRTLRRDLEKLQTSGLIMQVGTTRNTSYKAK